MVAENQPSMPNRGQEVSRPGREGGCPLKKVRLSQEVIFLIKESTEYGIESIMQQHAQVTL